MRAESRRRRGVAAVIAVLAVALSACTSSPQVPVDVPAQVEAQLPDATAADLEAAVTHAMAAAGASGAIVGVWAPWSGEWVKGVGTQAVGGGAAVTDDMTFRATMVTRAMTCDALYVLAERGTVGLTDSVSDYVSGIPDLQDVTLAQLCASTSGIGSYSGQLMNNWLTVPSRIWSARELATYGMGQVRSAEPGAAFRDSDAGYLLLGLALERASGQTASEILADTVFEPLDLPDTYLPAGPATAAADLSGLLGIRDGAGVMNCTAPLEVGSSTSTFGFTDSGVVTDIDDLGRYAQALASRALLPDGTKRYDQPLAPYQDAPTWYTVAGGAIQAGTLVGQAGSVPGYSVAAFADPATGLTVAVVLNNSALGAMAAQSLAFELAALASKAAPAGGKVAPEAGLPWTAQQYSDSLTAAAVCPLPEAAPAEG